MIFKPDLDPKKKTFKTATGLSLKYHDSKGRTMTEGDFGRITVYRAGNLVMNLLLNFLHLGLWFAVLWLVLEFRFWHALGMALVAWVALTLFVLPPTLNKAEEIAAKQAPVKSSS